jgi:hypothetical protein
MHDPSFDALYSTFFHISRSSTLMEKIPLFSTKTNLIPHDRSSDPFDARGLHVAAILTTYWPAGWPADVPGSAGFLVVSQDFLLSKPCGV